MYNLILADLYKARKSIAFKIIFGITCASAVAMLIIAYLIPHGKLSPSMAGIGFMLSDVNVTSIIGAVIAGIFICGDFDNRTVHEAIANGHSRCTVVISKAITFSITLILVILPYAIATCIALGIGSKFSMGSISVGFLNILSTESGKTFSSSEIMKLLGIMLTLIILYVAQLSLCVPLAILSKKPVLVVAIYYGLTILCAQLTGLKNSSKVFAHIFACTPYGGDYNLITLATGTSDIIKSIIVSLIFLAVMLAITIIAFRKSEIK